MTSDHRAGETSTPAGRPGHPSARVTAVIVAHNGTRWLPQLFRALEASTRFPDSLVAVDTGSTDETAQVLTDVLGPTVVHTLDAQERPGWDFWLDGTPDGETHSEVGVRADRVIRRVLQAGGDVAVFAHGHLLRTLGARWMRLAPEAGGALALGTAARATWASSASAAWSGPGTTRSHGGGR